MLFRSENNDPDLLIFGIKKFLIDFRNDIFIIYSEKFEKQFTFDHYKFIFSTLTLNGKFMRCFYVLFFLSNVKLGIDMKVSIFFLAFYNVL